VELVKFEELESKLKNLIEEHIFLKKKNRELEETIRIKGLEFEEANNKIRWIHCLICFRISMRNNRI
jgi:hypothetical protein